MAGISEAVLVAATVGNGLLAGVFFGFNRWNHGRTAARAAALVVLATGLAA
ncbi:MAG: hypothetical protein M3Y52_04980 [Actinomycetota bacterium]|nr:hypothetical protein [Actinomycetota bacterium]